MHCDAIQMRHQIKRHQQQVDIEVLASEYLTQLSLAQAQRVTALKLT